MAEKRKDSKGRVLKDGETQRTNGSYCYRYTDHLKKRHCVYAKTLDELRKKEGIIKRDIADGINHYGGECTVTELVDRYFNLKRDLKQNSLRAYRSVIRRIHEDPFCQKKVNTVKLSDAKSWYISLHDNGIKRNTISIIQSLMRPSFEMAVDDDIIRKNPFRFKLSDVISADANNRIPLTKAQQTAYLQFLREDGRNYYDDIVILLGTGMRVSELYGLVRSDIDMNARSISVKRQLCRTADKPYFVTTPKTKSGTRKIPMTQEVYEAFKRVISTRPAVKVEMMVDGCSGFLFLDKENKPKVAMHLQGYMRYAQTRLEKKYDLGFPKITPHVLRHTFCTNAQQAGLDVKSLQYIMGHSNASVTLDVYTHSNYDSVKTAFGQIAINL